MTPFKKTLIALDLSETDQILLHTVAGLIRPLEIGQLYLLHVMPDFTKPKHLDVEFYKLFNPEFPIDEKIKGKLKLDALEALGENRVVELNVEVVEGKPYEKLTHWLDLKMIGLLVLGHKKVSQGSGITAKRVVRDTATNVLYIPEKQTGEIRNLLVPIDFSKESAQALRAALNLSYALEKVAVTVLHVIPQPYAVYYDLTGEYGSFRHLLRESAEQYYAKFIKTNGFGNDALNAVFVEDDYKSISRHLHEYALTHPTDMIITGGKGHTALNNLLFGSVTESLLERCREKMILVVR